ncbi:hypothetical protein [Streptomyces sp. NPDC005283]|uniref:hypothetical protein n=1 Tax=Streptomyces sp. NPDC005283 TaxID=3156871 RepID=UPI003455D860
MRVEAAGGDARLGRDVNDPGVQVVVPFEDPPGCGDQGVLVRAPRRVRRGAGGSEEAWSGEGTDRILAGN